MDRHSGVTKGGHVPPILVRCPPPYGNCDIEKTYSKLLRVPPQKIACPPHLGILVTPLFPGDYYFEPKRTTPSKKTGHLLINSIMHFSWLVCLSSLIFLMNSASPFSTTMQSSPSSASRQSPSPNPLRESRSGSSVPQIPLIRNLCSCSLL